MIINKIIICVFLFFIFNNPVYSQNSMIKDIHKIIKKNFQNIEDNYFIFIINPNNGSNTNGHVIYGVYNALKKSYSKLPIFYIVDKDGISDKTVGRYFLEVLKIPFNTEIQKRTKVSKELYNALSDELLSKLIYIYNGEVFYDMPFKFSDPERLNFPDNYVKLEFNKKIKINSEKYLNTNLNSLFPYKSNILQLADVNNRIGILNTKTGNYDYVFDRAQIKSMDIYLKYISKSKEKVPYAQKSEQWFIDNNRHQLNIYNAYTDNNDIYLVFGMQYLEPIEKTRKFSDGAGGFVTVNKGDTFAPGYLFLMKCAPNLKEKNIYRIEDEINGLEDIIYPVPDVTFFVKNNILYSFNEGDSEVSEKLKKSQFYNKSIVRLEIPEDETENYVKFEGVASPPYVEDYEKKQGLLIDGSIFLWNDNIYCIFNTSPLIYNLNSYAPVSKLIGRGASAKVQKDVIPIDLLDTTKMFINWNYLTSGSILNNKYYSFVFQHQEVTLLEIKDKNLVTKQVINIDYIPGIRKGNIVLVDNFLYVFVFENDEFYLHKYSISEL